MTSNESDSTHVMSLMMRSSLMTMSFDDELDTDLDRGVTGLS